MVKSGHEPFVESSIGAGVIPTIPSPSTLVLHGGAKPLGQNLVVSKPVFSSLVICFVPSEFKQTQMVDNNVGGLFLQRHEVNKDF